MCCPLGESQDTEYIDDAQADLGLCCSLMAYKAFFLYFARQYIYFLTLKMPTKPASENVVCLCRLLNILANFSNLFLHTGKQCGP